MFQYRSFLLKEWRQLRGCIKLIVIGLLLSFYPALQCFSKNPILPIEFILPYLISFVSLYPSEFTSVVINDEFNYKNYEILKVSCIRKEVIILGKLTLPLLFSLIILISSLTVNYFLDKLTTYHIYTEFISLAYFIYCGLTILFSHLFIMHNSIRKKYENVREHFTLILAFLFILNFIFYFLYYNGLINITYGLLIMLSINLFLKIGSCYKGVDGSFPPKNIYYKRGISYGKRSAFCQVLGLINKDFTEIFRRYWGIGVGCIFLCLIMKLKMSMFDFDTRLFCVGVIALNCCIANTMIFSSVIKAKQNRIFPIFKVANVNPSRLILIFVLLPFIINTLIFTLWGWGLFSSISYIRFFLLNIIICLVSLLGGFIVKNESYHRYFQAFSSVINLCVVGVILLYNISTYVIIFLIVVFYLICKYIYKYRYSLFFDNK